MTKCMVPQMFPRIGVLLVAIRQARSTSSADWPDGRVREFAAPRGAQCSLPSQDQNLGCVVGIMTNRNVHRRKLPASFGGSSNPQSLSNHPHTSDIPLVSTLGLIRIT